MSDDEGTFDAAGYLATWVKSAAGRTAIEHGCDPRTLAAGGHLEDALKSAIGLEIFGPRAERSPEIENVLTFWKHADPELLEGLGVELAAAVGEAVIALADGGGGESGGDAEYGSAFDFYDQSPSPAAVRRFAPQKRRGLGLQPGRGMEPVNGAMAPEPARTRVRSAGVVKRRKAAAQRAARTSRRASRWYTRDG